MADSDLRFPPHPYIDSYEQHLPSVEIIVFKDSGHNVSKPDYDMFKGTLKQFLERIDRIET